MRDLSQDEFLAKRSRDYDIWLEEGKIPHSSKVIPVNQSLSGDRWIMPSEQVLEFLRNARSFAVANCLCRTHYKQCDKPVEICFYLNDFADKTVASGRARTISLQEAAERLKMADVHGLIHTILNRPDQYSYAICSCCSCCCHDLQLMLAYGKENILVQSAYYAQTDMSTCTHCGACVDRCVFGARTMEDGQMIYDHNKCYGCGLCISVCAEDATVMELNRHV
ncbi:MAG: 4Fe-4S dicluster domain-containing protein [Thermodesulfobacteriota bacterium]